MGYQHYNGGRAISLLFLISNYITKFSLSLQLSQWWVRAVQKMQIEAKRGGQRFWVGAVGLCGGFLFSSSSSSSLETKTKQVGIFLFSVFKIFDKIGLVSVFSLSEFQYFWFFSFLLVSLFSVFQVLHKPKLKCNYFCELFVYARFQLDYSDLTRALCMRKE